MKENPEQLKYSSGGDWIVTLLLMLLPIVNIILLFVWAFGDGRSNDLSKSNWAKAMLILFLPLLALCVILFFCYGVNFVGLVELS